MKKTLLLLTLTVLLNSCVSELHIIQANHSLTENDEINLLKVKQRAFKNQKDQQIMNVPKMENQTMKTWFIWRGKPFSFPLDSFGLTIYDGSSGSNEDANKKLEKGTYEKVIIDMKESIDPYEDGWLNTLVQKVNELPKGGHRIVFSGERHLTPANDIGFINVLYQFFDGIKCKKGYEISSTLDNNIYHTSIWIQVR